MAEHPLLDLAWFSARFEGGIGSSPDWLVDLLRLDAEAPFRSSDAVRTAVRDLLRHGGYKPAGRGKPASEFLLRAAGEGSLGSINRAVDLCNVVSLHSGLPISVVDLERAKPPFVVRIADEGASYVFNASGQDIRLTGLLCLHDAEGPCANAVKDCQRTKTTDTSTQTLCVIWGARALPDLTAAAKRWYIELHERAGATVTSP